MHKEKGGGEERVWKNWRGGNHNVRRVVKMDSSGEILCANYGKMILDRKNFSFLV